MKVGFHFIKKLRKVKGKHTFLLLRLNRTEHTFSVGGTACFIHKFILMVHLIMKMNTRNLLAY